MTNSETKSTASSRRFSWSRLQIHFAVAAVILAIFAFGWEPITDALGMYTQKFPVPWPEAVEVDKETWRNTSFPKQFGHYRRVEKDGSLNKEKDGRPDGEIVFEDTIMEALDIGTTLDSMRYENRSSNWYVARIYEDTRPEARYPYWQLQVYYYTGLSDAVPHVPEICGQAGGGETKETPMQVRSPSLQPPWDDVEIKKVRITTLEDFREVPREEFYFFVFNGRPETDRITVRRKQSMPWIGFVYFAKIQWSPLVGAGASLEGAEASAKDFMRAVLPHILKHLPDEKEVQKLNEKGRS
jgi:hypothetical protein